MLALVENGELLLTTLHFLKGMIAPEVREKMPDIRIYSGTVLSTGNASKNKEETFRFFSDQTFTSIVKAFIKKFPEHPDFSNPIAGYSSFSSVQNELMIELEPGYKTYVAIVEFADTCLPIIRQCVDVVSLGVKNIISYDFIYV